MYYGEKIPAFFFMVGSTPKGTDVLTAPANHSPLFYLDETSIPLATRTFTAALMKAQLSGAVAVMLACGCASVPSRAAAEPDQTFIDIFAQYNTERRSLQTSELERTFGAWAEAPTDEARQRAERALRSIDISRVMSLQSAEAQSSRSLHECLQDIVCGSYAVATMKAWAIAEFTPTCLRRAADGRWVELHYRGTSEDGMSGYGEVDFVQEAGGWKVSFESFGGIDESGRDEHRQPKCEDARG
jgi:hypothetical protein